MPQTSSTAGPPPAAQPPRATPRLATRPARYGVAVAAFLAALALRFALGDDLPPGFPFLTFFPAVILTAFAAGSGPATLCAALSAAAAGAFFVPAGQGGAALALGFFVAIAAVDIALIHILRRGAARLAGERALTARLLDEQRVMFGELQHRVANNMSFAASFLRLRAARLAGRPGAEALEEAAARLGIMGRIHRRLYKPERAERPVGEALRELAQDVVAASGRAGVRVELRGETALRLDLGRLVPLSLLAAEVVTNSLKHAFAGREGGVVRLEIERPAPGRVAVTFADDGPGAAGAEPSPDGLGRRIVEGLAAQLGASLSVARGPGMRTRVEFAA